MKVIRVLCSIFFVLFVVSCEQALVLSSEESNVLSFDKFVEREVVALAYDGGYLVEGDMFFPTLDLVKDYYQKAYASGDSKSTVMLLANGSWDKWDDTKKLQLTYCVSDSFGANKAKVLAGMKIAEEEWEKSGNIDLIYVPEQDKNATASNNNVVFNVRPANFWEEWTQKAAARTFFPSYARKDREFVIWKGGFSIEPEYLFPHELGHALGFRHEHIWFQTSNTEPDTQAEVLNEKDSASIMYYYYLENYTGDRRMTALDRDGLVRLYGAPVPK